MKKKVLFSFCLLVTAGLQAQVGVNNTDPKASLHITPQKTDGTTAEGIIAPNLTRAQLIGKDTRYTVAQKGAIVYVTAVDGTATTKTAQVTAIGYFYFDGTVWIPFRQPSAIIPTEPWQVQGSVTAATGNAQNIYQTGSVGIGSSAAVPAAYNFQVSGASNTTGNSRVASSTVVGAQTVGTTLGVTGATTLSSTLSVAGTSALRGATTVGTTTANANLIVYGNTGIGAAPAHKLHVAGNEYVSGVARIGGASTASTLNTSAQLDLADNNKGFLPNRVALTNVTVKAPVAYAVDGMMVYNTATVEAQDLKPGFYYWGVNKWNRLVDEIPETAINIRNLVSAVSTVATPGKTALNFGTLIIPEDGAYAFSFRLYGRITPKAAGAYRYAYYIYSSVNGVIADSAELDVIVVANTDYSYSVTLGCAAKAGDVITFDMAHYLDSTPWTLKVNPASSPFRTSMIWWKL